MLDQKKTFLNLMEAATDAAPERLNAALEALQGSTPTPHLPRNAELEARHARRMFLHTAVGNMLGGIDDNSADLEFLGELFWRQTQQGVDLRKAALLTIDGYTGPDARTLEPETEAFLRLAELAKEASADDIEAACKLLTLDETTAANGAPENLSDAVADFNKQIAVNHERLMQIHCGLSNLFKSTPDDIAFAADLFRHSHQTTADLTEAALIAVHGGSADEDAEGSQVHPETQAFVNLCRRALLASPEQLAAAHKLLEPAPDAVTQ
jgi:hypothetical protein